VKPLTGETVLTKVKVQPNLCKLFWRRLIEIGHIICGAKEAELLRRPEEEPDSICDGELSKVQSDIEYADGSRSVVVATHFQYDSPDGRRQNLHSRPCVYRISMGTKTDHVVVISSFSLGDHVVRRPILKDRVNN
jgi:hypothetical protein